MIYVANAFSLQMVEGNAKLQIRCLSEAEARAMLNSPYESCIGHPDTAAVLSAALGVDIPFNRRSITLGREDTLLVCQLSGGRLPEGCTTLPSGFRFEFREVRFVARRNENATTIYQTCIREAKEYADRDAYISDMALSSIWGDEDGAEPPEARLEWLGQLWDATRRSVRDIGRAAGMNQRELADHFVAPQRTVEYWCSNPSTPALYWRLLMQKDLGLLRKEV